MPAPQKIENKKTTMCVNKCDKMLLRRYSILAKNRKGYESDSETFSRILKLFELTNTPNNIPKSTYHIDE